MPHLDELFPGRFLKSKALPGPMTIRILSIGGEPLKGEDGKEKLKAILKYRTRGADGNVEEGEIALNKTNALLTAAILGTEDYTQWPGHTITVAHDPTVVLKGETVGGLRVIGSPELTKKIRVGIKRPMRKNPEQHTLVPTDAQGRVRTAHPPAAEPAPARVSDRVADTLARSQKIAEAFGATPSRHCVKCGLVLANAAESEAHACGDEAGS
jgi:hypothetical protein